MTSTYQAGFQRLSETQGLLQTIYNQGDAIKAIAAALGSPSRAITDAVTGVTMSPASAYYAPAKLDEAERQIARLNSLRNAGNGWAGPGSQAPSNKSLDAAISMLRRLRPLPIPVPMASVGSHGNAGLFWSDAKLYADVELFDDGRVGYLLHQPGKDEVDGESELPEVGLPSDLSTAIAGAYLKNRR